MSRNNTGNPLGSFDFLDFEDNVKNLDVAENTEDRSWVDRFGKERLSWAGLETDFQNSQDDREQRFQEFLNSSGYAQLGDYEAGIELTEYNQIFRHEGEWWRAAATTELPYTTTGDWATEGGLFVGVGEALLRQELASPAGAEMVGLGAVSSSPEPDSIQWAIDGVSVQNVFDLLSLDISTSSSNRRVFVGSFFPDETTGGGEFDYSPTTPKELHDGRNVISPTVPWNGQKDTADDFLRGIGETSPEGFGAWVRKNSFQGDVKATEFGFDIQQAGDTLATGSQIYTGGEIHVPTGLYSSKPAYFAGLPPEGILGLHIKGTNKQGSTLTYAGESGSALVLNKPVFTKISDLSIREAGLDGVELTTGGGGEAWHHLVVRDVRLSFNGRYGFSAGRGFMGRFEGAYATHNAAAGFYFAGPLHTSLYFSGAYSDKNGESGFHFNNLTYSVLTACAADNNTHYGYRFHGCSTTVMSGCGVESSQRSGVFLESTSEGTINRNIIIDGLLAFNNNKSNVGYPNAVQVKSTGGFQNSAIVRGSRSQSPANPTLDISADGLGAYIVDEHNDFPNGVASINGGYIQHVPKVLLIPAKAVTSAAALCTLHSTLGGTTSYAGEITVRASNQLWSSSRVGNNAIYKLLVSKDASGVSIMEIAKTGRTGGDGASAPSFSFSVNGNNQLVATPIGSTGATFYFEILTSDFVKARPL